MGQSFNISDLPQISQNIRRGIIESVFAAGSGHPGGALGIADLLTVLYFLEMNIDPNQPNLTNRDRFVLSPAHMVPALYSTLAWRGFFPEEELLTFRKHGSRLQGHAFRDTTIGVETTGGSLGQGLSIAIGLALASGMDKDLNYNTYCLISDGELNEGQTWEALMYASSAKLSNLFIILDKNKIQLSGATKDILDLEPLIPKLESFNFHVLEVDGHSHAEIKFALEKSKLTGHKTSIIILNTTSGKGVDFMEGEWEWHGKAPNQREYELAIKQLS